MAETLWGNCGTPQEIIETLGKHAETPWETVANGYETGET